MNNLDNLSALKVFARAAETRSFTETGNQLGLSASAVGKAVARLEKRLGVRVFHRSTRSIQLTDEGKQLLESCRRIFAELDAMESGFGATRTTPRGRLHVSLPLVGTLMMPTLAAFMTAYPEIALDLHFSDHLVDVVNDGFDVVVRTGEATDSRLIARSLGEFRLQLVGAPSYFRRAGIPRTPEDLLQHACLHHRFPTNGKLERWPLTPSTTGNDVSVPVTAAASSIEPLVALAEAGLGIACVPDFAWRPQAASGTLVQVLDTFVTHTGTFRAVWPASPYASPKLRAFVEFLSVHLLPPGDVAANGRSKGAHLVPGSKTLPANA
ncbi:LysR family transcriptional regulator [Rhodoferax koreense]|uniref:LysR family transcriptional regulator n=1 Tax=Rhodoferax koreensis TaxID=1842727 RepID=A0A1P8K0M3_9BURK|nr:LysR family transcriptional regulator [Rhodoferax koreense]APW39558.1 LysR family transcriptional regulator [Rhodoferax koreense]